MLSTTAALVAAPQAPVTQAPRAPASAAPAPSPEGLELFEKKIRPVLAEQCFACHSEKLAAPMGGLRLTTRVGLLKGGERGPSVVPGDPEKSILIHALEYREPKIQMPPKGKLSAEQIDAFKEWIRLGAPWPRDAAAPKPDAGSPRKPAGNGKKQPAVAHWAFQPLKRPVVPAVKSAAWVRNPIDAFIAAKLEKAGLKPNPAAEARTLIRRVTFDLTGMPPTAEEVETFVRECAAWANDHRPSTSQVSRADHRPQTTDHRSRTGAGPEVSPAGRPSGAVGTAGRSSVVRGLWSERGTIHPYERLVDRLLNSPRYGERWGRHWLDLVRYAETDGHEFDFEKESPWRYRDYVIRAFNADVPYSQLLTEHVAGDLLKYPRLHPTERFNESVIGTGFWWLGEGKHSPVDLKEDERERIDNQLDVYGKTFFGLSLGCARCHDHKFDPIPTKDYYALSGYLKSSRYQLAAIDAPEKRRAHLAALERIRGELVPVLRQRVASEASERAVSLAGALAPSGPAAVALAGTGSPRAGAEGWDRIFQLAATDAYHPLHALGTLSSVPPDRFVQARSELAARLKEAVPASAALPEGTQVFEAFDAGTFHGWTVSGEAFGKTPVAEALPLTPQGEVGALSIVGSGVADSSGLSNQLRGYLRSRTFKIEKSKILYRMAGRRAHVNLIVQNFQRIRDPLYGYFRVPLNNPQAGWITQNVSKLVGLNAYIEIVDPGDGWIAVDEIRFTDANPPAAAPNPLVVKLVEDSTITSAAELAARTAALLEESVVKWAAGGMEAGTTGSARRDLVAWLIRTPVPGVEPGRGEGDRERLIALGKEFRAAEASIPDPTLVMAMLDGTPEEDRVCIRGSHKSVGDVAPRRLLTVLGGDKQPTPKDTSGRLELAQRMLAHPLTARVMVNRIWQHHFGEGIVRTPDDFGLRGERPTHPELLEWLSSEFIRGGWSMKKLHRMILLSGTYRMSSRPSPAGEKADPQNKLLHRMPVRRLEAEAIRDSILAVSGRLNPDMYGPSVKPHLTPFMEGRGRPSESGPLDGEGRRSIYLGVRRNFLSPLLLAFDYPIPFNTIGRRSVSTVPAQALILMNNPFVVQQAGYWGRRVLEDMKLTPAGRVERMYLEAFARPATADETAAALAFVEGQDKKCGTPNDPRSWGDLAHVLINVKEFIFLD